MEDDLKEELLLKKLITEAGLERPSPEFFSKVMNAIEAKPKMLISYEPLISRNVWAVLFVASIVSIVGLVFLTTDFSWKWNFGFMRYISVPKIQLSTTMLYAIGFLSLFFLQIPFLQNYMKSQYRQTI